MLMDLTQEKNVLLNLKNKSFIFIIQSFMSKIEVVVYIVRLRKSNCFGSYYKMELWIVNYITKIFTEFSFNCYRTENYKSAKHVKEQKLDYIK